MTSSLIDDVSAYERWLGTQCKVVRSDIDYKHELMGQSAFRFLRATYFRWAKMAPRFAAGLVDAPVALCVGDAHVENFGTWHDGDGRLVWGVNDFDEASVMPYTLDLVRLLVSATLATSELKLEATSAETAILNGYQSGLAAPRPTLLEQNSKWFRGMFSELQDKSARFFDELEAYTSVNPPRTVRLALEHSLPPGARPLRFVTRRKGGGSLGRPRFLLIAEWRGGYVTREAKTLVPSAWDWAQGRSIPSRYIESAAGPYRSPDASMHQAAGYLIRRIAPDSRKLDLADVSQDGQGKELLFAMAADLAAVHAGSGNRARIAADLDKRRSGWLGASAAQAEALVRADYRDWRRRASDGHADSSGRKSKK